jgi:putative oxidoreductase
MILGAGSRAGDEPKLLIPAMAPFYGAFLNLYWPLIRLASGGIFLVHGIVKVMGPGINGVAGVMARVGIQPAFAAASAVIFLETIGAVCIIVGLFTRFFAAAIAVELAVVAFGVSYKNGFSFSSPGGGWEFPFYWGLIFLAIAMRGGGPLSVDRALGREL